MTRADVIAGLLLAAGFGAVLWEASSFQYGTEFAPGPGFAPIWLGAIGLILSLLVAVIALRTPEQPAEDGPDTLEKTGLLRVGATLLGLVVMLSLVSWLGLVLSVLVFLLFMTLVVQRLPVLVAVGASLATAGFVYLVFVRFLGVPIPSGPLGF